VVHGIPDNYQLKENDIVSIDMGMKFKGLHVDEAWTILVNSKQSTVSSQKIKEFLAAGVKALEEAIKAAKAGNRVGHISLAIEKEIKKAGFSPIQALTGHGIGKKLHEEPQIPCFLKEHLDTTPLIKPGMTLAIEVIYSKGNPKLVLKNDGWTLETADGNLAALFEKTVFVS
jgi:methionyl aminopeptidase